MMAINRRQLMAALAGAVALRVTGAAAEARSLFIACRVTGASGPQGSTGDFTGDAELAVFDRSGAALYTTALPARGHDIAISPDGRKAIVFARRPGNWAVVFDLASQQITNTILSHKDRHFYGHGCFSADGTLLMATENDYATGQGKIGLYDAHHGFKRIGELDAGGIGPHDMALLPNGATIIANGGVKTHPDTGRKALNLETMQSSLSVINRNGEMAQLRLPSDFRQNSIRHMAVARDGTIGFGCQWEGDEAEAPPLIGLASPNGSLELLKMPDDDLYALNNYIGSVAFNAEEDMLIATAPRGNCAVLFERKSRRFLRRVALADVCGAAAIGHQDFLLSSGREGVMTLDTSLIGSPHPGLDAARAFVWDNHIRAV
jgi:uncharacterized protein